MFHLAVHNDRLKSSDTDLKLNDKNKIIIFCNRLHRIRKGDIILQVCDREGRNMSFQRDLLASFSPFRGDINVLLEKFF